MVGCAFRKITGFSKHPLGFGLTELRRGLKLNWRIAQVAGPAPIAALELANKAAQSVFQTRVKSVCFQNSGVRSFCGLVPYAYGA